MSGLNGENCKEKLKRRCSMMEEVRSTHIMKSLFKYRVIRG
jgi:hypothetical protein